MAEDMRKCYIVLWENGTIFIDRDKSKLWLGGSPSLVFAPVFPHKKDAQKFARRARRLVNEKTSGQRVWVQELEIFD